jgi:hypothetical protein
MARGFKTGGKVKGSKNRATIERELKAAAQVAAASGGKARESALAIMERLLTVAEGATAANRPILQVDIQKAAATGSTLNANPDGDWGRFHDFLDLTFSITKELAKYQAPQIKAVDAPTPPPAIQSGKDQTKRFTLTIFEGDRQVAQAEVEPKATNG